MSSVATTSSVVLVQEPAPRAAEMPELASMALLSVVLAGVSVMVRRAAPRSTQKSAPAPEPERTQLRPPATPAAPLRTPTAPVQSSPTGS